MAGFLSKSGGYTVVLKIKGGKKRVVFENGVLDTKAEAERLGVAEKDLVAALKKARSYGVRFTERVNDPNPPNDPAGDQ